MLDNRGLAKEVGLNETHTIDGFNIYHECNWDLVTVGSSSVPERDG